MALRPIDTDVLEDVCSSVARQNYGFIYVNDTKSEIKNGYEQADTGMLNAGELSISDIRQGLSEIAADDFTDFTQIRDGVYYMDQFGSVGNEEITEELKAVFSQHLVITGERLRDEFSLAIDDLGFFVDELESREYIQRIRAGKNDYYTIGPKLKEGRDKVGLDEQLADDARDGKISHSKLERAIDVSATTDVIRYLENENLIIDLDGEYLVRDLIEEFAYSIAEDISDDIEDEFENSKYILQAQEFTQVIKNEIRNRSDVLSYIRDVENDLITNVVDAVSDLIGVEIADAEGIARQVEEFEQYTASEARRIHTDVKAEVDPAPGQLEGWVEAAEDHISEIHVSNTNEVNEYIRNTIRERYKETVDEEEFGGMVL